MANEKEYILPGTDEVAKNPNQMSPLLHWYSPRLFGAPPQLTNQCDMRIMSGVENEDGTGANPGPVGDFYLKHILQDATVANFCVGRARFLGGMSSKANFIREAYYYLSALNKYGLYGRDGKVNSDDSRLQQALAEVSDQETYKSAYGDRDNEEYELGLVGELSESVSDIFGDSLNDIDANSSFLSNISAMIEGVGSALEALKGGLGTVGPAVVAAFNTSMSVQRPFYEFEMDWHSYINNVKTMVNSAVIMLGLQDACVRIGDQYWPIGLNVKFDNPKEDVWANYRYITPTKDFGTVTANSEMNGDTTQYMSFMIDPTGFNDSITNEITQSQLFGVVNQGSSVGAEIAFLTNATGGSANDMTIKLAKESKEAAEDILKNLASGNGRFTAAIASSMARSFVGEHTIYPEIFTGHEATTSANLTIHLVSDAGDAYSYLINILVPIFYILGMALPQLSNNNAAAYSYPPVIQCNIPGLWGTRLGMIRNVTISKNSTGTDRSVNGYPLSVDVTIQVQDLCHVLLSAPMDKVSTFLNNNTMFDYIAQMAGVDKYRVNGSMRTITKLALAASWCDNAVYNVTSSLMTDWNSLFNKINGFDKQ